MEYQYYNKNPKYKREPDCVVRAISGALGMGWGETYRDMVGHCIPKCLIINGKKGYKSYLKSKGYPMEKMPKHSDNSRYTVSEFANEFNKGTYILSIANHLTFVEDGTLYDTWNCSYKSVGNYWKIK